MIDYRVKLADYLRTRKVIAENFFSAAAASRIRTAALEALGPPPIMLVSHESTESSHDSHKIEAYGSKQELSVSSLEIYL